MEYTCTYVYLSITADSSTHSSVNWMVAGLRLPGPVNDFSSFTYFSDILFKGFRPQGLLIYRLYLHKICTSIIFIYDSTLLSCSSFCVFKISMHHTVLIEAFVLQVDVLHSSTVTLFIALLAYRVCDSVASSCDGILHTKD